MDTTIITLLATISGVVVAWITFGRASKKDAREDGIESAQIKTDIEYIKRGVDDIKLEQRSLRGDVAALDKRLVAVEASTKSAHKRLDGIVKEREDREP